MKRLPTFAGEKPCPLLRTCSIGVVHVEDRQLHSLSPAPHSVIRRMRTIDPIHVGQVLAQILHGSILVGLDVKADTEVIFGGQAEQGGDEVVGLGSVFVGEARGIPGQ
jgi:hypothetical protein